MEHALLLDALPDLIIIKQTLKFGMPVLSDNLPLVFPQRDIESAVRVCFHLLELFGNKDAAHPARFHVDDVNAPVISRDGAQELIRILLLDENPLQLFVKQAHLFRLPVRS